MAVAYVAPRGHTRGCTVQACSGRAAALPIRLPPAPATPLAGPAQRAGGHSLQRQRHLPAHRRVADAGEEHFTAAGRAQYAACTHCCPLVCVCRPVATLISELPCLSKLQVCKKTWASWNFLGRSGDGGDK